ncbi:LacI family DNA-binding transcriptional regulator [Rufibacter tibetensis]|uniref:PurR family transcriptional regulator n=1 Tax=Rufibacter tibetensis TaxID=512763 RepID=A0A0N7HW63_9BACT|nr:LacI family DNA-binding transcriptional regulator [Rufibacter tibetensis]ALI98368.1 PurR family transcriptional regulator [Rufibacter tibetensis]
MKKRPEYTIKDIAAELGLSISSVSRALNDHPHQSEETKRRVREAVEKLNYRHNALAASLRNSKSNTIGLIVPKISMYFISSVVTAVQNKLQEFDYNLMVCQSNDSVMLEKELVNAMYAARVEGLIVSTTLHTEDFSHFDVFKNANTPLVFFDRVPLNYEVHKLQGDDFQGGYRTTLHLLEQGCRQIAHIGGPLTCSIYRDRFSGYLQAMKEYDTPVDERLLFFHELTKENTLQDCNALFSNVSLPDAVFACNDTAAITVVQSAKQFGLHIPSDLKVAGYSNDPRSEIIDPDITSVEQYPHLVGERAAVLMMDLIHGQITPGEIVSSTTPVDLIIRKSTGLQIKEESLLFSSRNEPAIRGN